eukprot:g6378.t1
MGRGRGRLPPPPGVTMGPASGRGGSPIAQSTDAATADAAPSWMSFVLKSNDDDDDDDDFAQPVPVSSSTTVPEDKPASPTQTSTRLPPWAKPYKAKATKPSDDGDQATAGKQSTASLGSGMPKWGQKANVPVAQEADAPSPTPRADGVPDWLQATKAAPAASATDRSSQNTGVEESEAGGLDWLQDLAGPAATATGGAPAPSKDESSPAPTQGQSPEAAEEEVDWVASALKGTIPSIVTKRTPATGTSPTKEEDGPENSSAGDDWLAIAKSSGQTKRKSPPSSVAASAATQGGWLSSGKIGLPTEDDGDEGDAGTAGGGGGSTAAAPTKPKKKKKQAGRPSSPAGGSAGWLASGALGISAEDESDEDDGGGGGGGGGGGSDDGRGVGVTIETQTEDDIEAMIKKGAIEKGNAPKLPPWAKPWVPPPKLEVVPETASEVASGPGEGIDKEGTEMPDWLAAAAGASTSKGNPKAGIEDTGTTAAEQVNPAGGDGDEGGLSWLTNLSKSQAPATAQPTGASSAAEPEFGSDWLSVAKSSGQPQSKPRVTAPTVNGTAPGAPGGWMSSGKLGISTEDDSDQDDSGKVEGGSAATTTKKIKKKKKKQAGEAASTASVPGGWLGTGALGIPTEDESDVDDDESEGGGQGVGVTMETQTADDIEAVTEGRAIEKEENAPKLPPWAKPWVPPPKPEAVPHATPEVTSAPAEETQKKEPEVPDWLAAAAGATSQKEPPVTTAQGDNGGDGGGMSWLTSAVQNTAHPAKPPAGASSAAEPEFGTREGTEDVRADTSSITAGPAVGRRSSLSGGMPRWAATSSATAVPKVARRPSLSGGMPPWAPASSTAAAPGVGRRPSLSGGMPRWAPAPAPAHEADVTASVGGDRQSTDQEKQSEASEKTGKPAASEVRVSDWLAAAAGAGSEEKSATTARDERGQGANQQGDTNGEGGLDWLTNIAAGNSTPSATSAQSTMPSATPAVNGSNLEEEDWIAVANSTGQAKRKAHNSPETGSSAAAAPVPGGWMSLGKLGLPTGDGSDEADAGKISGGSRKTKKKKTRRSSSFAGGPAGWLGSGALGVPVDCLSDEDDVSDGDGGGGGGDGNGSSRGVGVTIETQTDDDIQAVTEKGAIDKENAPKLPPWAKPWVPTPKPEVVPETAPEMTSALDEETDNQEPGLPDWLAAAAGATSSKELSASAAAEPRPVTTAQGDNGGDDGGMSWLTSAVQNTAHPAKPPAGASSAAEAASGNDWLAAAASSGQPKLKPTQGATGARRASSGNAATAGWMSSGKLGLPAGSDSDEDGAATAVTSNSKKGKQTKEAAVSAASGAGGWLGSGALGVPVGDESDEDGDGDGGGDGRPVMTAMETQTEDDIEAVTARGDTSKLPPWAKPWTPPPKPEVVPDGPPEEPPEKEECDTPATPDWIASSVGVAGARAADGSGKEAPASGGGLDWLAQVAQPESDAAPATAGVLGAEGANTPDWLQQASTVAKAKPTKHRPATAACPVCQQRSNGGKKVATMSTLSWMSSMKRRSSMDLEDSDVQAVIAQAKAKTVPGGWLQTGALGAPDAVEEENQLDEARAASSLGSLSGGPPPWAPQHQSQEAGPLSSTKTSDSPDGQAPNRRRPSLAGGMPPWAPADKIAAAATNDSGQRKRRSSLDGGMPAWAPPPSSSSHEDGATPTLPDGLASPSRSSGQAEGTTPALPDWLAAVAGGESALQGESSTSGDARDDGDENDWLAQAALSSTGATTNRGKAVKDAEVMIDDAFATTEVSTAISPDGNAAGGGELASNFDWLSAAAVSSSTRSSKASSAKVTNIYGSAASAPASWLTLSIASGKLGNPGDHDETREDTGDKAKDAATQTDDVTISEVTRMEETLEKPKSKLPPWAKPWTPPTPAAAVDAHPSSSSSIDIDDHQVPSVEEDGANAGGHSSAGSSGLDWINATVTGEQEISDPTGCKYCGRGWYHETV